MKTKENKLYFYDAAAPIVEKSSINMNIAFYGDRYSQEKKKEETEDMWKKRLKEQEGKEQSYINLPMNKEEYEKFLAKGSIVFKDILFVNNEFPQGISIPQGSVVITPAYLNLNKLQARVYSSDFTLQAKIYN